MTKQLLTKIRSLLATENGNSNTKLTFMRSVLLTNVIVTGAVLGVRQLGILEGLELGAYDQIMRSPDQGKDNRLLVVAISATDI